MDILSSVAVALAISLLFSEIVRRLHYPEVIGQIIAGMIFSIPVLSTILSQGFTSDIEFLSQLGIVFLLLLAGLEINLHRLEKLSKDATLVSIFSAIFPFLLGFFGMKLLGFNNIVSIVVGASLSITAEGTTLKVLMDLKQLNTKIGTIILGAGIIDDIIEVILLALILVIANDSSVSYSPLKSAALFPFMVVGFAIVCLILFRFIPRFMRFIQREHSRVANFSIVILLGIGVASLSQFFGLGPIIGAFIAGVMIHWVNKEKKEEQDVVEELKVMTFAFIVPFFFIYIGMHFDYTVLFKNPLLVLCILFFAVFGKILGSVVAVLFSKNFSFKQSLIIGWGMNSRGAMELVIAEIARSNNLISLDVYSAIVIMAVITTLIFPFALKYYVKKYPNILKE